MSETLHELCCLLVEEFYGSFHGRLFSQLTYHGRLSAPQVAQKCHLPIRQVKYGLCALVQNRLAYHHTTSEGSSTYQANITTAYDLVRNGRLVELARDDLGDLAAIALSEAIVLGFATTAELETRTIQTVKNLHSNILNDADRKEIDEAGSSKVVRTAVEKLVELDYLTYVRSAHFQTNFDARQDVEKLFKISQSTQAQRGKRANQELDMQVENALRKRLSAHISETGYVPDLSSSNKRSMDDIEDQPSSKKQKLNGGTSAKVNGTSMSSSTLIHPNHGVVVSVNFSKLKSDVRNKYLLRRANKNLGVRCGKVLMEALSQVPSTEPWSLHPAFSILDVGRVRDGINSHSQPAEPNGYYHNGVVKVNGVHSDPQDEYLRDTTSYSEVERNLALLKEGDFNFLQGSRGQEWHIAKDDMDQLVRNYEILRMMADRLQPPALRIVRMLVTKGKLDEKTLQELGLLGAKELRQTLAQLKQMGYIDLQEVPRESQRQPNRTIFLWFHDSDRVQRVLLESLYKAMTRLMQRLGIERKRVSSTLEKIERSDVKGSEEQMMSTAELRVLRRWQKTEQWLLGELSRLDESVVLLRDL